MTVQTHFVMPSEEAWEAAAQRCHAIVQKALRGPMLAQFRAKEPGAAALPLAICMGALTEVAMTLEAIVRETGAQAMERYALAYVRGALRDAGGPIHDDGRPFVRIDDA